MPVRQHWTAAPSGWPTAEDLRRLEQRADLVLLPDRVERSSDGTVVAAFRDEAQAIRVDARRAGLRVELGYPAGSAVAAYREHAADWVLPFVLSFPSSVAASLIANRLHDWLGKRSAGEPMPTVRVREVDVTADEIRVREIEGPADDVIAVLEAGAKPSDDDLLGSSGDTQ